jgi:acetyl-CoA carboxylase carboxyl transferase subunit beta
VSSLKDLFQKKKKYATIPSEKTKREIPEGLMNKCPKCGTIQFNMELYKSLKVCSTCGYHFILNAPERLQMILDEDGLFEYDSEMISENPLGFPDYEDKLAKLIIKTGLKDGVMTGEGTIGDSQL